jgi:acylphosphatase
MSIEGLVVEEAARHIALYGCVRNMDPMSLHILKTSENPTTRAMRAWMRSKALQQVRRAEQEQIVLNKSLADAPVAKGASVRRRASIAPYYAEQMRITHNASWSDPDFVGSVREAQPKMFPRRDVI